MGSLASEIISHGGSGHSSWRAQDSLCKAHPETRESLMGPKTNIATCYGILNIL